MKLTPGVVAAFWLTFRAAGAQLLLSLDDVFKVINQGGANSRTTASLYRTNGDKILVKITSKSSDDISFRQFLESNGVDVTACVGYACDGFLDSEAYATIRGSTNVVSIKPSAVATSQLGSVVSEAVEAHRIDEYRADVNAATTGAGMKIGVLSDSFDNLNGYATDIATGDLPAGITVLKDLGAGGIDEGRAMLQLIADIAPDAELFFRTAFEGPIDFAVGIGELADAGCDVIVDDIVSRVFCRICRATRLTHLPYNLKSIDIFSWWVSGDFQDSDKHGCALSHSFTVLQNHFFRTGSLLKQLTWLHEIEEFHTFRPQETVEGCLGKEYFLLLVLWCSTIVSCMSLHLEHCCKSPPCFHTANHSTDPFWSGTVKG